MSIIETIVLGAAQGMTEFIPVSSSGHLVLLQNLFSGASEHLFLEFINIGTVLALVVYFRKRIAEIFRDIVVNKKFTLFRNILITSIPAGLVGYMLADFINEAGFFGSAVTVMVALFVVGVIMVVLDKLPHAKEIKSLEQLSAPKAGLIGIAQVLALIPGVSRSGSTIISGRLLGFSNAHAAEYSFLASLPIMLAVTAKVFIKQSDRAYFAEHLPMLVIGNIVAFVAGYLAIGFLLRYLSKHGLGLFGWYRIGLAVVVGVLLLVQLP